MQVSKRSRFCHATCAGCADPTRRVSITLPDYQPSRLRGDVGGGTNWTHSIEFANARRTFLFLPLFLSLVSLPTYCRYLLKAYLFLYFLRMFRRFGIFQLCRRLSATLQCAASRASRIPSHRWQHWKYLTFRGFQSLWARLKCQTRLFRQQSRGAIVGFYEITTNKTVYLTDNG